MNSFSPEVVMRILLTGDHSDYHCGSAAAFRAIYDEARSHGRIVDGEADDYDLLVVNGEGSMHHDSRSCRSKMKQIRRALVDGRQVALVNSVWQDNPTEYAEVLKQCCSVVVREVCSARELASLGVHADVNIDQAFFCEVEDVEAFDFKGDVLVTDFYSKEFSTFIKVTGKWADKFTYIDLNQWDWSRLIHSMRTASLIITGRHHAVYAACKAKLPFLALEGNTSH